MTPLTKGTTIQHYSCGNLVSAEVVFAGGRKIITRHDPQVSITGEEKTLTVIEWYAKRKKPLPLAYLNGEILIEKHFAT